PSQLATAALRLLLGVRSAALFGRNGLAALPQPPGGQEVEHPDGQHRKQRARDAAPFVLLAGERGREQPRVERIAGHAAPHAGRTTARGEDGEAVEYLAGAHGPHEVAAVAHADEAPEA